MEPIHKSDRMPGAEDLDPFSGYCWWFDRFNYAWMLCCSSWGDDYVYWLPYSALPDPYPVTPNETKI